MERRLFLLELSGFAHLNGLRGFFWFRYGDQCPTLEPPYFRLFIAAPSDNSQFNFYYSSIKEVRFSSFLDSDGSVVLRPGNKYEYTFGFELPQQG